MLAGKKIKRRLEDLEKRAVSSSPSPEQTYAELSSASNANSRRGSTSRRQTMKHEEHSQQTRKQVLEPLVTPYSSFDDAHDDLSPPHYRRDLSMSPPDVMSYSYSLPDPTTHSTYSHQPPFNALPPPSLEYPGHSMYLPSLPTTLPAMTPYGPSPGKNSSLFDDGDIMNQYSVNYTPFTSMELPMQQSYQDSNLNVNIPDRYFRCQL